MHAEVLTIRQRHRFNSWIQIAVDQHPIGIDHRDLKTDFLGKVILLSQYRFMKLLRMPLPRFAQRNEGQVDAAQRGFHLFGKRMRQILAVTPGCAGDLVVRRTELDMNAGPDTRQQQDKKEK